MRIADIRKLGDHIAGCQDFRSAGLPETLDPMSCASDLHRLTALAVEATYERLASDRFQVCSQVEDPARVPSSYDFKLEGSSYCIKRQLR
jgi:hypothetical protein